MTMNKVAKFPGLTSQGPQARRVERQDLEHHEGSPDHYHIELDRRLHRQIRLGLSWRSVRENKMQLAS